MNQRAMLLFVAGLAAACGEAAGADEAGAGGAGGGGACEAPASELRFVTLALPHFL